MRLSLFVSFGLFALLGGCASPTDSTFAGGPFPSTSVGTGGVTTATTTGGGIFGTYDEPVVVANPPPPAVSGGTLLILAQGHRAAVADPERDHVVIVDLDQLAVTATIALQKGDEPGRLVEDGSGLLHVVLRGSGAVATIDPTAGKELGRQLVCGDPRGIAYDAVADNVLVACVGGELVTLKSMTGEQVRRLQLDTDLRDVVIDG